MLAKRDASSNSSGISQSSMDVLAFYKNQVLQPESSSVLEFSRKDFKEYVRSGLGHIASKMLQDRTATRTSNQK